MSTTAVQAKEQPTTSLFDFLGRKAGPALGAAVAEIAKLVNEPTSIRQVDTYTYKGPIVEYRYSFLKFIFNEPILKKIIEKDTAEYNKKRNKTK